MISRAGEAEKDEVLDTTTEISVFNCVAISWTSGIKSRAVKEKNKKKKKRKVESYHLEAGEAWSWANSTACDS